MGASSKSKMAISKRKSKTPSKAKLLRRSRQLAAAAAAAKAQDADATVLSSDTTTKTTASLMSTIMSNTNASSCSSNASKLTRNLTTASTAASSVSNLKKGPPQSSSSRFASAYNQKVSLLKAPSSSLASNDQSRFGVQHKTSTASNTFIEEENLDDIENYPSDSVLANSKHTALFSAASAKLASAGFPFQAPSSSASSGKFNGAEINYLEFTVC